MLIPKLSFQTGKTQAISAVPKHNNSSYTAKPLQNDVFFKGNDYSKTIEEAQATYNIVSAILQKHPEVKNEDLNLVFKEPIQGEININEIQYSYIIEDSHIICEKPYRSIRLIIYETTQKDETFEQITLEIPNKENACTLSTNMYEIFISKKIKDRSSTINNDGKVTKSILI